MVQVPTGIEWTDESWNPITGCSKVSPGCAHCYAETLSLRFGYSTKPWTPANAKANVILHPQRLGIPLRWRRPRMVFVNSMSDLFHPLVADEYIDRVFEVMIEAQRHTFQVLTKRPERMRDYMTRRADRLADGAVPTNVWLGTSIENNRWVGRADALRETPAAVRFLSCEPLLGALPDLDLTGIDWVIVGGESGAHHRPLDLAWVRDLRDRCQDRGVAFFFKQVGGRTPKAGGRTLDDQTWDEMPSRRARAATPQGDATTSSSTSARPIPLVRAPAPSS